MLDVSDLHAYYGKSHILQGVSFSIGEGEIVSNIEMIEMIFDGPPPEIMSLLDSFDDDELAMLRDLFE